MGLIGNEDQVVVAADVTANVSTKYSVVVNTPDASEPTVVTGGSNTTQTFSETLSKPPAEKTALQKYADMDEDILSETVMEGKMHSSSSSSSGNASDKDAGAKTPTGEGLSKKSKVMVNGISLAIAHFQTVILLYRMLNSRLHSLGT